MALKKNSLMLLSWLYPSQTSRWISIHDLKFLLPSLSSDGIRSLVGVLTKANLIEKVPLDLIDEGQSTQTVIRATSYATDAVSSQFSAFRFMHEAWKGQWSLICFIDSPKSDPQFRYLRNKLVAQKAGQIKSGLYAYPGELPPELFHQLTQLYVGSVAVWKTDSWRFGDERQIIGKIFGLNDEAQSFSSLSNQLTQLLNDLKYNNGLIEPVKKNLFMVFNRWVVTMEDSAGIYSWYFPQVKKPNDFLSEFHAIYASIKAQQSL
jgi:hypothetical protein